MKSNKNQKSSVKSGKQPTKSESFAINEDGFMLYLYGAGDKAGRYIRVDFKDYVHGDDFVMVLDRKTLKGMADFIYEYLGNK